MGASAGGVEAFKELLECLPADSGMAFVLIQHLDPTHRSLLATVLGASTKMPIVEVRQATTVEPNRVYVMPENVDLLLRARRLIPVPRADGERLLHLPIDEFMESMAAELGSQAIGVVLSGTASDGTEGLRAIKSEGGITLVQDPRTAKFGGMPESALRAEVVDQSLSLPKLAAELARLSRHPYLSRGESTRVPRAPAIDPAMAEIFSTLRTKTGVDFTEYKAPTIRRRLSRRMTLLQIEQLDDYVKHVHDAADEASLLVEDVLIHVTSFFRDPQVFDALKKTVFPAIISRRKDATPIRIWVPGCSSGEEAYSIGMALFEYLGPDTRNHRVQIFGSDLSDKSIALARKGLYPETAVRDLPPERLNRFFTRVESGYCIDKLVRDCCVFVKHDLGHDPPFSRLDLVSCRNALIYFGQTLQKRVLELFIIV